MACGNNEGNKQVNNNNNEGNDNNSNNDGNVEEVYKLKLNDLFPPTKYDYEPRNYATNIFSEKVKEATDGRVEIEVFNSAQLAQTDQLMDVLSSGSIDFGTSGAHLFGDIIPASHAINLPFWAKDEENAKELLNSEYGDIFKESFEDYGVKVMIAYPTSNQIIMSTNPVKTLDDFNGKLFRIESGLWDSWYQEIGLSPVNVDSSEIYNAMQLGTIDGLFYADYTLETANYHEV